MKLTLQYQPFTPMQANTNIVNKLWGYCHVLRHDGMDYGDYVEQLTYLLFLKMAEERSAVIPKEYSWSVLKTKAGTELLDFYTEVLRGLALSSTGQRPA